GPYELAARIACRRAVGYRRIHLRSGSYECAHGTFNLLDCAGLSSCVYTAEADIPLVYVRGRVSGSDARRPGMDGGPRQSRVGHNGFVRDSVFVAVPALLFDRLALPG